MDAPGAGHLEEGGHRHVADLVEGPATEATDLPAGHPHGGRDHRLNDHPRGEDGRSVMPGRTAQQRTENGVGQLVGQSAITRAERGEQLGRTQGADPGIGHATGHGGDVVGQPVGHQPVGHGALDGRVGAQR